MHQQGHVVFLPARPSFQRFKEILFVRFQIRFGEFFSLTSLARPAIAASTSSTPGRYNWQKILHAGLQSSLQQLRLGIVEFGGGLDRFQIGQTSSIGIGRIVSWHKHPFPGENTYLSCLTSAFPRKTQHLRRPIWAFLRRNTPLRCLTCVFSQRMPLSVCRDGSCFDVAGRGELQEKRVFHPID